MTVNKKKWITYGIAGVVGLALVGGAAAATAANMDLQTDDGSVVPGGPVVGKKGDVIDRPGGVVLNETDTSVSVVSAPSSTQAPDVSAVSVASAVSAPSAQSAQSVASAASN